MKCAVNSNRSFLEAPIDVYTNNICCNDPECVLPSCINEKLQTYEYYHQQGEAQEGKKTKVSFLIYAYVTINFCLAENITRHARHTS